MSESTDSPDDNNGKYPLSDFWVFHDGFDIERTNSKIVALVIVSRAGGEAKDLRFYAWRKKGEEWKVELARIGTKKWNWEEISKRAMELKQKHGITSM